MIDEEKIDEVIRSISRLADAVCPNVAASPSPAGGYVASLTEAVMDVSGALVQIAGAIEKLAQAVEFHE